MKPHALSEPEIIEALLDSYKRGYFPMAEPRPPWNPLGGTHIYWPSPDPRGVLPLTPGQGFHVSRRLQRRIDQRPFTIHCDTAFERVMQGCALPRKLTHPDDEEGTWIDPTLIRWFLMLHEQGYAHSVEAYRRDPDSGENHLVGGVYGISIGSAFFGESMFHIPRERKPDGSRHPLDGTDASKTCLVLLVRHLADLGFTLFDTQMVTEHVSRFGGIDISRREYLHYLTPAVDGPSIWQPLDTVEQAST